MRRARIFAIALSLFLCSTPGYGSRARSQAESARIAPKQAEQIIGRRSRQVILALKSRNMARLASLVHPRKGLRFSPYHATNLEKGGDLVFTRTKVKGLLSSRKRYAWGEEDGSGDPIRLTYPAYHRKFVYDHDYLRAKNITYNAEFLSSGNLVNNLWQTYPSAIIVEYNFPGFEEKYGGMDWNSVWLIFEKDGSQWYLVGIAHGEWTI